ncbi:MAG TPA: branched-chain amino acid ABC transporter permease [Gaiellaceae bacterium]|nr:branched-chain amino acid ABC transporter permease [Gaiellaceae bacterium]
MSGRNRAVQVVGPVALVVLAGIVGSLFARETEIYFISALISVVIVVALHVFVGNSGVLSFGHASFVAVGAWAAGVLSVPVDEKAGIFPSLFPVLGEHTVGNVASLGVAAAVGGAYALVVGLPLMRLSGLAAGIATFAVLEITHNVLRYWDRVGPGTNSFSSVPETTGILQAAAGATIAIVVAFGYQTSRYGRQLRATREDAAAARAVGIPIVRQRLWAFAVSGALAGFGGGLLVHFLPVSTEDVYLNLTFITLAMLVIGGIGSLWGAVVGALAVSALDSFLAEAEIGIELGGRTLDAPSGSRLILVGFLMALTLVLRPSGLTGGRELSLPRLTRPPKPPAPERSAAA